VRFVTERAVFGITDRGLTLLELAPGADLENDVLANGFRRDRREDSAMDAALFRPGA